VRHKQVCRHAGTNRSSAVIRKRDGTGRMRARRRSVVRGIQRRPSAGYTCWSLGSRITDVNPLAKRATKVCAGSLRSRRPRCSRAVTEGDTGGAHAINTLERNLAFGVVLEALLTQRCAERRIPAIEFPLPRRRAAHRLRLCVRSTYALLPSTIYCEIRTPPQIRQTALRLLRYHRRRCLILQHTSEAVG
jgi:hypothetical protein